MGLVIIEGVDGSGKTTLVNGLIEKLRLSNRLPFLCFNYGPPAEEHDIYATAAHERGMLLKSAEIFAKLEASTIILDRFHLSTFTYGIVKRNYPHRLAEFIFKEVDSKLMDLFDASQIRLVILAFKDPEHLIPKRKDIKKEYLNNIEGLTKVNTLYQEAVYLSEIPRYTFYVDNLPKDKLLEEVLEFLGWND